MKKESITIEKIQNKCNLLIYPQNINQYNYYDNRRN